MSLVLATVFAVIAIVMPEARRESLFAAAILLAVAWLGVPALVRLFSSFTGDEEILANGVGLSHHYVLRHRLAL
jgi:hypothetical protein